jgi:DNA polymerase III subunit alpha
MPRIKSITPIENSGIDIDTSKAIFEQISRFAGYGFNKSHAAAYAAISFQTAYLKTHHPEAFFAAAMNLHLDEVKDIATFACELKARNVPLWQPEINQSRARFQPLKLKKRWQGRDFGIAYALSAIRGVGISAAEAIENERVKNGPFNDIPDFTTRMADAVNRTALTALAKAGAFDSFGVSRAQALGEVEGHRGRSDTHQMSMFDAMDAAPVIRIADLSNDEVLDHEFDVLGHYMSAHPLDDLQPRLIEENLYFSDFVLQGSTRNMRKAAMPAVVTDTDVRRTNAGDLMAILTLSDPTGTYEALCFGETWSEIRSLVRKKSRLVFDMGISIRGDERRLIVEGVTSLGAGLAKAA